MNTSETATNFLGSGAGIMTAMTEEPMSAFLERMRLTAQQGLEFQYGLATTSSVFGCCGGGCVFVTIPFIMVVEAPRSGDWRLLLPLIPPLLGLIAGFAISRIRVRRLKQRIEQLRLEVRENLVGHGLLRHFLVESEQPRSVDDRPPLAVNLAPLPAGAALNMRARLQDFPRRYVVACREAGLDPGEHARDPLSKVPRTDAVLRHVVALEIVAALTEDSSSP